MSKILDTLVRARNAIKAETGKHEEISATEEQLHVHAL